MTTNDPNARPSRWPQNPPSGGHPQQPNQGQRPPATSPDDPGFHEQNTLEAAQFKRPEQPTSPPPQGPPTGWPTQPPPPQWPNQPGAAGYPTHPAPGGQGYPPPTGQPPQQPPGRTSPDRKRWALIGGAVAAVALLVAVAIINFSGVDDEGDDASTKTAATSSVKMTPAGPRTPSGQAEPESPKRSPQETAAPPPPPPPPPVIAPEALGGFLLPAEQIGQIMGSPGMKVGATDNNMIEGDVTPPNCTGAWGPVHANTYNGSGFTGMTAQAVNNDPTHKLVQGLVAFPNAAAAQAFYDRQVADWNGCKFAKITATYGSTTNGATLSVPSTTGGILSLMVVSDTSTVAGMQCERAMTLRNNVIVDVRACSPNIGSSGWNIARDIGNKIAPMP
ncbi:sensor domain-containing protein [Mycobacterium sp. GA-2829]|uniref:sensor domain-containing protein n=1 Tax=Mycobacterium sp. GA-2829 TaxID=1772283 RepID=UPI000AD91178|nr:sensor domain-containing protein [Mycobacterium sp. GA-2829]